MAEIQFSIMQLIEEATSSGAQFAFPAKNSFSSIEISKEGIFKDSKSIAHGSSDNLHSVSRANKFARDCADGSECPLNFTSFSGLIRNVLNSFMFCKDSTNPFIGFKFGSRVLKLARDFKYSVSSGFNIGAM